MLRSSSLISMDAVATVATLEEYQAEVKASIHQYASDGLATVGDEDDHEEARQALAMDIGTLLRSLSHRAEAPLESHLNDLEMTVQNGLAESYITFELEDDKPYPHLQRILSEDELLDIEDDYEARAEEIVDVYSDIMSNSGHYDVLEEVDGRVTKFHYIPSDERLAEEQKLYTDVKDGMASVESELKKFHALKRRKNKRSKQMQTPRRLQGETSPMFDDPNFAGRRLVTVDDCDEGDSLCGDAVGTITTTTSEIGVVLNEIGATLDLFEIVSNSCE